VTLLHPFALWGLTLIGLLLLLERWRRRPRPRTWPSLLLWRALAEVEAPARPRVETLLLYECAAVFLLALAAAEPGWESDGGGREIVFAIDCGPHMLALREDGRTALDATLDEVARVEAALGPDDRVRRIRFTGTPPSPGLVASSRPGAFLGRAPHGRNLAVDAVSVRGDRLWFALASDGEPADVTVRIGGEARTVRTGVGVEVAFANEIRIEAPADNYAADNVCRLRRLRIVARDETGSPFVRAALRAGTPVEAGDAGDEPDLVIRGGGEPLVDRLRGSDCIVAPGIFEGLLLDECVWRDVRGRAGDGLLSHDGVAVAQWLDGGRTLWLGLPTRPDWDDRGTLAVLIERAKRARVTLAPGEAIVGDAVASPGPGLVMTRGVDRPWDGVLPEAGGGASDRRSLRLPLALCAALVLGLYLRAMMLRRD